MITIAEKGETVIYTGNNSYAVDSYTGELMSRFLVEGKKYEVVSIFDYGHSGVLHYRFKDIVFSFPCRSFCINFKQYFKEKYNLK